MLFLTCTVFSLALFSCEKENFKEEATSKKTKGFEILSYRDEGSNARGVENNILSFETEAEFNSTLDSLETAFDNYQLSFQNTYKDFSDEELNQLVNTQNIDLEEPLTNFEEQYSFNSLRQALNNKETIWLNAIEPNFDECPQIFPIEDHVERTLWNEFGEIMIAGKIYKYEDERYIKIDDGDFNKLALINSGNLGVFSDSNVFTENIGQINVVASDEICTRKSFNTITNEAFTGVVKVISSNRLIPRSWEYGKHKMYSSTYNYRLDVAGSNTWKKFVVKTQAGVVGQRYVWCGQEVEHNANKIRLASSVVYGFKRDDGIGAKYFTNFCSLNSTHQSNALGYGGSINNLKFVD